MFSDPLLCVWGLTICRLQACSIIDFQSCIAADEDRPVGGGERHFPQARFSVDIRDGNGIDSLRSDRFPRR